MNTKNLNFFMYSDKQLKHRQQLMNLIVKLHKKYPKYTYSMDYMLKHQFLYMAFNYLMLQNERKVASINLKNETAFVYHQSGDKITDAMQARKYYMSLKHVHFYNQITYEVISAKALFDTVFDFNPKTHKPQRQVMLWVDNSRYHTEPIKPMSDYEVADSTEQLDKTIRIKGKTWKLDPNYPITYFLSNRHSYKVAKIYKKAISKLSFVTWPTEPTQEIRLLQLMVAGYRNVAAKGQKGCKPIVYARTLDDVNNTINAFGRTYSIKNKKTGKWSKPKFQDVVEAWTKGIHRVPNKKAFRFLLDSAYLPYREWSKGHRKPSIAVYNHDGLTGIQMAKDKNGKVYDKRRHCWFRSNAVNKSTNDKDVYEYDGYLAIPPVTDPITHGEMKPSKIISIRNPKAKRIKKALHKKRQNAKKSSK